MKTKFEITKKGVEGRKVGDVVEFEGEKVPGFLLNKGRVLTERVAVTNPATGAVQDSAQERQALLAEAAKVLDDEHFSAEGVPDVREINALLDEGVAKFSAAERDQLWPGIADAVKADRG
ncbi:hypothetical protein [Salipiger bermudensis]|uniref:hypothetical protein n=1 Tax=Salipiger bermudensis TaxID=344736 RepID=UPI001CD7292B|nr:hypothetical protein [Salipiger bermudensis]MCA0961157.1 hypothetical protein [Salipiger bermudensis]